MYNLILGPMGVSGSKHTRLVIAPDSSCIAVFINLVTAVMCALMALFTTQQSSEVHLPAGLTLPWVRISIQKVRQAKP